MSTTTRRGRLAIEGGPAAVSQPIPPMYPGGMRIDEAEERAVLEVLRTKRLFRYYGPQPGPSKVAELEEAFAQHMGARYALAVASGTTALTSAFSGLRIGPGDEVVVPAYTWISTAAAVVAVGAVPVIAEVDESLTLDPQDFEAKITQYTRAVVPVHMRGAPCAMDEIMEVARRRGVSVVEDAAQAAGAGYHDRRVGSIGDAGIFSLQFNKILTSGEGGMVITDDETQYQRALMYHDVAASQRSEMPHADTILGINCRLSELQGAVALVQLGKLEDILADCRRLKRTLKGAIAGAVESKTAGFRRINDDGEAAISLVFYMDTPDTARYAARALEAEGVGADVLFEPDSSDYHVYYHWAPILNRRYWGGQGPWAWSQREVTYSQDMCPRTLDLLGRAVHIDVSPDLTDRNVEELAAGVNKVLHSL